MDIQPKIRKKDWQLSQEGFEGLLRLLDEDRERAGAKYEALRARLLKLFEWRGSLTPEEHADETLNRVARKVSEGLQIRNVHHFIGEVARRFFLETLEERERAQKALNSLPEPIAIPQFEKLDADPRLNCFRACLNQLAQDQRMLIVDYYREDERRRIDQRKALAARLQIPLNALRIRAHRLRAQLDDCIVNCLRREPV